jgi:hypothetical protein
MAEFGWHTCCREYQRLFDALVDGAPLQHGGDGRH